MGEERLISLTVSHRQRHPQQCSSTWLTSQWVRGHWGYIRVEGAIGFQGSLFTAYVNRLDWTPKAATACQNSNIGGGPFEWAPRRHFIFKLQMTDECSALNRTALSHSPKDPGNIPKDRAEQFKSWRMGKSVKKRHHPGMTLPLQHRAAIHPCVSVGP